MLILQCKYVTKPYQNKPLIIIIIIIIIITIIIIIIIIDNY